MSEKCEETKDSDDEFHDAISDAPAIDAHTATSNEDNASGGASSNFKNEEIVEEITRNCADLKLPDEEGKEEIATGGEEKVPEFSTDNDTSEEELHEREKSMSNDELQLNKEQAERMKLEGNEYFKNGDAVRAIEIYTEALQICPTTHPKERAILFGNRAASKIKIDSNKSAVDDCTKAIQLWPDYTRVLMRRAKLYELEEKYEEALEDYKRVYELDPGQQREAREAIARLPDMINERNERMKEEMMSKLKDLGNLILKPFGLSTSNFQMQQDPNTGSYSINFNQNSS